MKRVILILSALFLGMMIYLPARAAVPTGWTQTTIKITKSTTLPNIYFIEKNGRSYRGKIKECRFASYQTRWYEFKKADTLVVIDATAFDATMLSNNGNWDQTLNDLASDYQICDLRYTSDE